MSDTQLGKHYIPDSLIGTRDAVHVATIVVVAGEALKPNDGIDISQDFLATKQQYDSIAVVDPFLTYTISKGKPFIAVLRPGSVFDMKHKWYSTKLDNPDKGNALKFINEIANKCGKTSEAIMEDFKQSFVEYPDPDFDNYIFDNSERYKNVSCQEWNGFLKALEIVLEQKIDTQGHNHPYTCAC